MSGHSKFANMANEQVKVTKQKLVQLMCEA